MIRRSSLKETRSPVGRYHLLISFFYVPLFCRWLFMDVHLGCDNPRVDVNLSIHCETARCSFGGAEETHMFCNPHIGFVKYHRIAMVNARLTIFSSCTIAISASFRIFAASSQLMITVLAFVIPMAFAGWDVEFRGRTVVRASETLDDESSAHMVMVPIAYGLFFVPFQQSRHNRLIAFS